MHSASYCSPTKISISLMAPRQTRLEKAYPDAVELVLHQNYSLTAAVSQTRGGINKPTLAWRVKIVRNGLPKKKIGRRTALSATQEKEIALLCLHYASRGKQIWKEELTSLVEEKFGNSLSHVFKVSKPGAVWIKSVCERNKLSFSKPNRQAAERFASTNAEVLTTHLSSLESIMTDLKNAAQRLFNLDETGITPGKDFHGTSKKKAVMDLGLRSDRRSVAFVEQVI